MTDLFAEGLCMYPPVDGNIAWQKTKSDMP